MAKQYTEVWDAHHESNNLSEWAENGGTGSSASSGSIGTTDTLAHTGTYSAVAGVNSGSGNKYGRTQLNLEYGEGDKVSFGCWFYLPSGFKAAMQGEVQIFRWDCFPTEDRGGIAIDASDKKVRVRYNTGTGGSTTGFLTGLDTGWDIPEEEWFHIRMDYTLSESESLTELYINGEKVGESTTQNWFGEDVTRIRAGIVAINSSVQTNALTIYFDDADVSLFEEVEDDPDPPTAVTGEAQDVTHNGAILHGTVNPNGSATIAHFEWGTTTEYGITGPPINVGSGESPIPVQQNVGSLDPKTEYHFRVVGSNDGGEDEGDDETFETTYPPIDVVLADASEVTHNSAKLSATINPNGVTDVAYNFEWGPSDGGWPSTHTSVNIGDGTSPVPVERNISGLDPETEYHFRITAVRTGGSGEIDQEDPNFEVVTEPKLFQTTAAPPGRPIQMRVNGEFVEAVARVRVGGEWVSASIPEEEE